MRLINVNTHEMKETYGGDLPGSNGYAILSHTWGDEEVTLAEWNLAVNGGTSDSARSNIRSKKGYLKIIRFLEAVKLYAPGTLWAWVDTCCIDKTSSAELSEAINSMFKWYRSARVCYAYLSDVSKQQNDFSAQQASIKKSRWFTRGWTLQELLAPPVLRFFDEDWRFLGDDGDIDNDLLAGITGIPRMVLDARGGRNLDGVLQLCSTAQKLRWAACRVTTREEDVAYCLMGILGINMPLLYGEGGKAFIRLQEEIMRTTNDHTIFAWKVEPGDSRQNGAGVLARHPSAFQTCEAASSSRINRFWGGKGTLLPYQMTNSGLRLTLPVLPIGAASTWITNSVHGQVKSHCVSGCERKCSIALLDVSQPSDDGSLCWAAIYISQGAAGRRARRHPDAILWLSTPFVQERFSSYRDLGALLTELYLEPYR